MNLDQEIRDSIETNIFKEQDIIQTPRLKEVLSGKLSFLKYLKENLSEYLYQTFIPH